MNAKDKKLSTKEKKEHQMRLIHWESIKEDYSQRSGKKLVDRVVMSSKTAFLNDTALQGYNSRLMAVKVVLVVPV